jgi:hypothetical protein
MSHIDRRAFLQSLAAQFSWYASVLLPRMRLPGPRLDIVMVGGGAGEAFRQGVDMGVDEAARAATLFGGSVAVRTVRSAKGITSPHDSLTILLGGRTLSDATALAAASGNALLYMNALCREDALHDDCWRAVFHVAPAAKSLSAVQSAFARKGKPAGTVTTWDASLTRFGADTLNKRFVSRYGTPMTDEAWQGWCAVKIAWEAALRSRATTILELSAYLVRESARFDAHKGEALYFDARHELVQPLYLVAGDAARRTVVDEKIVDAHMTAVTCK